MDFYQIFLSSATFIYIITVFVVRSLILWKLRGINPFVFGNTDKAHDYIGKVYKTLTVMTIGMVFTFAFLPNYYHFLVPIEYLSLDYIQLSGMCLFLLAFIWTVIAQYQMSASWRIGIDYNEKTELIKNGLFSYSRNPVFVGIIGTTSSTFLMIPNIISFTILICTYITIQIQVRLEEEYLSKVQGTDYKYYRNKVPRWM